MILADCWDHYESTSPKPPSMDQLISKMEDFLIKLYSIIYTESFHFDHIYPTRSLSVDSELFKIRERMIKLQLAPLKYKQLAAAQA